MMENTQDIRWQQRFENYQNALKNLSKIISANPQKNFSEIEEMAIIQSFEFTFELAWKTIKDYLEYQGELAPFPRETIKKAFERGILNNGQAWMQMLTDRNITAHIYDEQVIKEIVKKIVNNHFQEFIQLEQFLNHAK